MRDRPTKAVIPAAGLGTRFLPATKAMPKEMLPVVDKPAIQYVVEEAIAAGLDDVLMITGRNKQPLENHFDRVSELEDLLEGRGDEHRLALVRHVTELADVHYLRQGDALGLGHAVLRARQHVGTDPFAVLLGDDLIVDDGALLGRMLDVHQRTGASVVALGRVPREQVSSYGVVAVEPGDEPDLVRVRELVEKPAPEDAPSDLVILGRYVLRPEIFDVLERTPPGRGGEIQLTDALQTLAGAPESGGVVGVVHRGRRYDTGNRLDYLKAVVELACADEELGPALTTWLRDFVARPAEGPRPAEGD